MSFERSAGLVIFRKKGAEREYLVVKSRRHGAWGFPKGHVDAGETDEETARRETIEETGLADFEVVPGFSRELRYPLPKSGIEKQVVYFLAEAGKGAEPTGACDQEIGELRWAKYDVAMKLLTFANTKEVLEAGERFLAGGG